MAAIDVCKMYADEKQREVKRSYETDDRILSRPAQRHCVGCNVTGWKGEK
jgi:hypothetical protein